MLKVERGFWFNLSLSWHNLPQDITSTVISKLQLRPPHPPILSPLPIPSLTIHIIHRQFYIRFLFVSHSKGNFSLVFFQARSPPKLSFHIQSVKVVELNGVGWGEPIRSIFTLEWKLHPTSQIISHSPSIKDFISKLLSSLLSSFFHWQHLKYENGSHKGIFFLWHLLLTFLCSLTTKENINENH